MDQSQNTSTLSESPELVRRTVSSRNTKWAAKCSSWLCRRGVSPNQISIAGVIFALIGGVCAALTVYVDLYGKVFLLIGAIIGIQGRLLCNLFDGMVAIEGGMKSKSGELFNDFPDRLSDTFLIVGVGLTVNSTSGIILGFTAAITAMLTAYARVLSGAAGAAQRFSGPMAKQHRMALLTLMLFAMLASLHWESARIWIVVAGLSFMIAGTIVTTVRRLIAGYRELEAK